MARTDEERFKIQYMRLKREAEARRLAEQEKIRLSKQLKVPRVRRPIQRPTVRLQRPPVRKRKVSWFDQWGSYFKDGGTIKQRRKL